MDIVGTRGFRGKKAKNSTTMYNALFVTEDNESAAEEDLDSDKLDNLASAL
jgi:hypothetical protein